MLKSDLRNLDVQYEETKRIDDEDVGTESTL